MRGNRYLSNSFFGLVQTIISSAITLSTIPLFIGKLGEERYGIFATLAILGNINIFANLGLSTTLRKFLAAQGKSNESNLDIVISFSVVAVLSSIISTLLFVFSDKIILDVLSVPVKNFNETKILFFYLVTSNLFIIVGQILEAILDSQERIEITSLLRLLNNIFYWGLIMVVLSLGYGLEAIGLAIVIATLIWFISLSIKVKTIWGTMNITFSKSNIKRQFYKQLSYSTQVYTAGLITIVGEPLIKILISNLLGVTTVGYYEIGSRIRSYLSSFIQKFVYPLFPILARQKSVEKCAKIVFNMEIKVVLIVLPVIICVILLSEDFLLLWTGQNSDAIWHIMIGLIVSYLLLNNTIYPSMIYFLSTHHPNFVIYYNLFYGFTNILVLISLSPFLGYKAIIVAEFVALLMSFLLVLYFKRKIFGNPESYIPQGTIKKMILILLYLAVVSIFLKFVLVSSLSKLILIPIATFFTFAFLIRLYRIVSEEELNWLISDDTPTKKLLKTLFAVGISQ